MPDRTVSVCLTARNDAGTIAAVVGCCTRLRQLGIVDEVVVVHDATDGTAELAAAAGATVYDQSSLLPRYGPVQGRGDAMWRALTVLQGDVVVFLDANTADPRSRLVTGLLVPLLSDASVRLVKGYHPTGGGPLTQLTARPLLRRCFPQLSGIRQPLAGEIAADRELLHALAFQPGDGVDVGLLIDTALACGPEAIAQANLDVGHDRDTSLEALSGVACVVADVILDKAAGVAASAMGARPPLRELRGDGESPGSPPD